jgi:hypothetical protein
MSERAPTKDLSDLQQARRLWLDAETRAFEAEARCTRLYQIIAELQQKLIQREMQHASDHLAAPWFALAAEIRSKL